MLILQLVTKLSILIDLSTILSNKSTIAIRTSPSLVGNSKQCMFLDFDSRDAQHTEGKLMNFSAVFILLWLLSLMCLIPDTLVIQTYVEY
jgi:hypothetical protein